MKKQYIQDRVTYGYSTKSRKWEFQIDNYTFLTSLKGGNETAVKIAKLVQAGHLRSKNHGIDGLARNNINNVLQKAIGLVAVE